ncbi:MAG: cytochrome oxidase putative small subunit CydP [Steroidobacteraceae bacterium]|jgi:hypothetical protein
MPQELGDRDDWRRDLRSKIAWTLIAKVVALTLLWALFFRGRPV